MTIFSRTQCDQCQLHTSIADFIDITNASNIGMMDKDIGGKDHIISITVPGKTYYLSASSCDDRSQWLLALRAYKYNDESKVCSIQQFESIIVQLYHYLVILFNDEALLLNTKRGREKL